ncbi:hypothetical protein [Streptomyces sp. NPDC127066]|uniref:hypothetical protein n=1 Tax=Streptomyces sp. NPDC127066 TaxID=3347125 RepID=UPI0036569C02
MDHLIVELLVAVARLVLTADGPAPSAARSLVAKAALWAAEKVAGVVIEEATKTAVEKRLSRRQAQQAPSEDTGNR